MRKANPPSQLAAAANSSLLGLTGLLEQFMKAGLGAGCSVLVNDTAGRCAVQFPRGIAEIRNRAIHILGGNGGSNLFHQRLKCRPSRSISLSSNFALLETFFGAFSIGHGTV